MVRPVRACLPFLLWLFALGFSCTIIEDSDIQSLDEVSKLKLSGVEISQVGQDGKSKVTRISTSINASGKIQQMSWPSFSGDKFSFRSTTITGAVTSLHAYNSAGMTSELDFRSGNVSMERYLFEYNPDGTLHQLTSEGTFPGNITSTVDIIEYKAGRPNMVIRKYNFVDGSSSDVNYNISYNANDESVFSFGTAIDPNSNEFLQSGNSGDCSDNADHSVCNPYSTANNTRYISIRQQFNGTKLNTLAIGESYNPGGKTPDKYTFHPLMLLRSEIKESESLMIFYMIDWWGEKNQNSGGGGNVTNDLVIFNFSFTI